VPRQKDPRRIKAREAYQKDPKGLCLATLARELNIAEGTLRVWKSRDKWDEARTVRQPTQY
jgi:phage terminase small subunit